MGEMSMHLFGRELPERAIIRAGAHFEDRAHRTLQHFDKVGEIKGSWLPYCFAEKDGVEMVVIFNVYGAAPALEALSLFSDGGVKQVGFIGSAFAKREPVGRQLLVTSAHDRAGVVLLDGGEETAQDESVLDEQRSIYERHGVGYTEVSLLSVPTVMHGIQSVRDYFQQDRFDALEMELSTFYYFGKQHGMKTIAYIYTADNPDNHIIAKDTRLLRQEAQKVSSRLLIDHMTRY